MNLLPTVNAAKALSIFLVSGLLVAGGAYAADPSGFASDDFSAASLDTGIWSVVDPQGDGTVAVNGTQLLLTVPAGSNHDVWTGVKDALRVMQPVNDTGFELEIKFESPVTQQFQLQGILVEQDAGNFIRFDFYSDGAVTRIFAASFAAGSPTQRVNTVISSDAPLYMRVTRVGDQWIQSFSVDGVVWNPVVSFSYPLVVNSVGAFAGNSGGGGAPAHTAVVDYFFSTASPISPEDGVAISDTTAPFIRDVRKIAGLDQFQMIWSTDEPASGVVEYGLTTGYELGQVEHTDFMASHDLVVTGLVPDSAYHFRLRSTDASGNERVSDDFEIKVSANPYIDNWYGPVQNFGQLGSNSARWINLLGNVSGPNPISSVSYTLEGQASQSLNLGADTRRLQDAGDINAEIEYLELLDGANTVAITATDTVGNASTETVTLNYASGNTWPLPYAVDWATSGKIEDVAQIVDGAWSVENDGVRTAQLGYDRLLSIGDISWDNYEVTVPVTLHGLDPGCSIDLASDPCRGGAGLGVLMRWPGHYPSGAQPSWVWTPMGALGWYRWRSSASQGTITPALYLTGGNGGTLVSDPGSAFPVGVTQMLKMRAETVGGQHEYKIKMWLQGQPEPTQWDLEGTQALTDSLGNGSLLLLAHYADATFGNVSVVPVAPDNTAPVISNIQVAVTDSTATITWDTDEAADSVVDYGLTSGYGATASDPGLVTSHSVTLSGLSAATLYHYQVSSTDGSANTGSSADLTFTTAATGGSPSGLVSDGFDGALDTGVWTFVDPVGDSTVSTTGSQVAISVPAGTNHDLWTNKLFAPRIRQAANNTDFEVEVKFDSPVSAQYQQHGITVEQDGTNLLRFDFYSDGTVTRIFSASFVNGTATRRIRMTITDGVPLYLRVTRVGDQWTESYSYDGANWIVAGSYTHTLVVTSVGVFAGNAGPTPPAYTALIDYFTVDGLPPGTGGDSTPPVISNVQVSVTDTTATVSWTTDEASDSVVDYGLDATYGTTASDPGLVTSHSVTLSGLSAATLYHYQVSSTDGSANTGSSADLTLTTDANPDTTAPVISNVQVSVTDTTATVSWTTDEASDSVVDYGLDATYGTTASDPGLVTSHSVTLSGLSAATLYHYQVSSTDGSANTGSSADLTLTTAAVATGRVADWPMNEGFGTTTADTTGNGHDGTLVNGPLWAADRGLDFDGVNDYVDVGSLDIAGSALTLTAWFRADNLSNCASRDCRIISKASGLSGADHYMMVSTIKAGTATRLRFRLKIDGTTMTLIATSGDLLDNQWVHVAAVYDGATMKLYKDGVAVGSLVTTGSITTNNAVSTWIGGNPSGATERAWDGQIDDVRAYSRALTAAEIAVLVGDDSTPPVISNIQVAVTDSTATITWDTDEAADSVVDYGLTSGYGATAGAAGLVSSHSVTLSGLSAATLYHYQVSSTDGSANTGSSADLTFTTAATGGSPSGLVSDGFDGALDTGVWTFVDPVGDSTVSTTGSQVAISVPAGTNHDLWTNKLFAPRIRQAANNTDFEVEVKFDSPVSAQYQQHGITVEQDGTNLLRFDFYSDGTVTRIFSASFVNGTATRRIRMTITDGVPLYLRVTRVGDQWTESYSYDGANWIVAGSYTHTLVVTSVGVFAGNAGPTPPAYTALIDYFTVDGLPPGTGGDSTPPVISNVQVSVTDTTATVSWTTDEASDSVVDYGLDATYGTTASDPGLVTSHSVTLSGLSAATLYHYQVSSTDGSANTGSSADLTLTTDANPDTTAPVISNVQVSVTDTTATVSWTTDEASDSVVDYGLDATYGTTASDPGLVTSHSVTLSGLSAATLYHYQVSSTDGSANTGSSADLTLTTAAVATGRVADWPMNEGFGTTTADTTGNGHDGTLVNGPLWAADRGLDFDGVNDYVDVGSLDIAGSALTLTAWFRADNLSNCASRDCRIISKASGLSGADHYMMVSTIKAGTATRLRFRLKIDGTTMTLIATSGDLLDNQWVHVAAVYDGATMKLYKDGVAVGSLVTTGSITTNNAVSTWIGGNPSGATERAWDGQIDDVRAYSRALTAAEIAVLVGDDSTPPGGSANAAPVIETGTISFAQQIIDDTVVESHAALAADLDGDLDLDVVATGFIDGVVFWYENDGAGGFIKHTLDGNLAGAYPAHVADVEGDGDTDVLVGGYTADTVVWYANDGLGNFTRIDVDAAVNGPHSIVTEDLDEDGDLDLLTANQVAGTVTWYKNDGSNSFTRQTIDSTATGAKRAVFADIDNDGDRDVVAASYDVDEIAWYENDGSENFTKRLIDTTANGAYYVFAAHLNGDGSIDVLAASRLDGTIAWHQNDGSGNFSKQILASDVAGARSVVAADVDGDGDNDVVATSVDYDTIAWYENDGNGNFVPWTVAGTGDGGYDVFATDMDDDGDLDMVSASTVSNDVAVHYQLKAHRAILAQGATRVIDSGLLLTSDTDDAAAALTYTVTEVPGFGQLRLDGGVLSAGSTFTQDDVNNSRFSYVHDGSDSTYDTFAFTVADGGESGVKPAAGTFTFNITGSNTLSGLVSDDFESGLNTGLWTFVDPVGDSTVSTTGSQAAITVPAGTNHDLWSNKLFAARIRQAANNTDFEVEVKFDSAVNAQNQLQGITVEQDGTNLLRFDFYSDGAVTRVFSASIVNGTATQRITRTITDSVPLYLRVTRMGDQWTESYSYDGFTWIAAGTYTHSLTVTSLGVFAGNAGSSPPAHTALVDYFIVDNSP